MLRPLTLALTFVLALTLSATAIAGPPAATVGEPAIYGADWIARQPPSNYTLQLLATINKPDVGAFIRTHRLSGPVAQFDAKDTKLHVVVQGSYASRGDAAQAASRMPDGIRPWIRKFSDLTPGGVTRVSTDISRPTTQPAAPPLKDAAWLWSRDPSHFTIQLRAGKQRPELDDLSVGGQGFSRDQLALMVSRRDHEPWYGLLYGEFPDRAAAEAAINRLPPSMRKDQPTARSFGDIHDELSNGITY